MNPFLGRLAILTLATGMSQEPAPRPLPDVPREGTNDPSVVGWKEGKTIPVRVPLSTPGRELMSTVSFPEDSIETAVTGWPDGEITAIQKRGLLFLRLTRRSEGQLNVIGGSGSHYLLYLKAVDADLPGSYDAYLKIEKRAAGRAADPLPRRQAKRPSGAVELLQAMRLGLHPEAARILRARGELVFESASIEVRLVFVYDAQSYRGLIYDVRNRTGDRLSVDASRLHGRTTALVLSALRENVLEPNATTRLYAVTWKD
jgi:hypothetical protein